MELITGHKGSPHVTAAQFAALARGFLTGTDSGVLIDPATEDLEAQIQSNNQIRIRSGIGVFQGRAFWVQPGSYDEVTINNGNQGENRIDLIVARYVKNPETAVESINWQVIQGTPTTGMPIVPPYIKGNIDGGDNTADLPLYKVTINGITIKSVEAQFTPGWLSLDKLGGMGMELVWSNAAPGSAFGPQEIKMDLSQYSGIMILAKNGVTAPMLTSLITYDRGGTSRIAVPGGVTAFRDFAVYVNGAGINFNEGREIPSYGAAATTNNARCIPLKIYGILGKVE